MKTVKIEAISTGVISDVRFSEKQNKCGVQLTIVWLQWFIILIIVIIIKYLGKCENVVPLFRC